MSSLQASRYELKFLISEAKAKAIQKEVAARMKPDTFTKDEFGYHIRSLYLDSRHLDCYQQTNDGVKNRFKLRVRFYDDACDSPVFLEVKRRVTNVIQKKRAGVSRESASKLVRGGAPTPSMLLKNNAQQRDALVTFCRLRDQLAAVGHIYVDYFRQAFECDSNNQYRVTFDREVCGSPHVPGSGIVMPPRKKMSRIDGVVLELKFVNKPARWMTQLTKRFGLQPISVPKYVECVNVLASPPWIGAHV
jgi:hypothetical protein